MNKMMKREDDDDSWRRRQFIQLFFVATNRYELLACFLFGSVRVLDPVYQAAELGLSLRFLWQFGVSKYALLCRFEGRLRSSARVARDSCFFPFS
jgi:hypothetical protein